MTIDLRSLRTVVAAADHGSLRRAAAALNTRQSTLSRRIRQLEQQMGVTLFERSSSGVRSTVAGSKVVRTARRLLEQLDRMTSLALSTARGEAGDITIGVCTPLSANRLRAQLARYLQAYPDIEIQVVERARSRLLDGLTMGDIDIAIVTGEPKAHDGPSMRLWSERVVLALPTGHRLTRNDIIYWTDLKGESFLLSQRGPGPDLHGILVQKLPSPTQISCWNIGQESILAMLDVRQRISVQCESWMGLAYPGVVCREVRDATGPTYLVFTAYWKQTSSNPALARFIELLRKNYPPAIVAKLPDLARSV